MGLRFIFMLTRNDRTVAEAADHLDTALSLGVRHVGFKDVGLPVSELKRLNKAIKAKGAKSYLEVVSLDRDSELASARAALDIGVDVLLGGTRVDDVAEIITHRSIEYFPFPGCVTGHPSVLEGTIQEIAESAAALASRGVVSGLDLLAYRSTNKDIQTLIRAVCEAANKPVIVAGSIASKDRIADVRAAGAAGFTIGTAALDGSYPANNEALESQLSAIVRDVAELNGHLSPFGKKNLDFAFDSFNDTWSPRIAGKINNMHIKLVKLEGNFTWHFHTDEDELFLVHRGRMLMRFRDREEILEEGEFIVVPKGVEHCPVALSDSCEVVLLEPTSTLNTGNAIDQRRTKFLASV
ncbi:MAG: cupin domain-containing protein [Pseudomonadota bacterium]